MPSGRTHDRITLWTLPVVAGLTFAQTRSGNLTLLVAGGFLFSGLMFGPDLDIYSRQFQRWGWLRWIWLPYQSSLRHRSFLSHGPLIGSALRLLYLAGCVGIVVMLSLLAGQRLWDWPWNWDMVADFLLQSLKLYYAEWIALYIGLELGSMSHYLSDWVGSAYKRIKKYGLIGWLFPGVNAKKGRRTANENKRRQPKGKSKF